MFPCYSYFNDLVRSVSQQKKINIQEFNLSGGNGCGKTTAICETLTRLSYFDYVQV
jgi:aspartyl aminopeptidase